MIRHQTESLDLALTIEFLLYSPKSRRTFYDFTVSRLEKGSTIKVVSPSSEVVILSEGVLLSYIIDFENLERNWSSHSIAQQEANYFKKKYLFLKLSIENFSWRISPH